MIKLNSLVKVSWKNCNPPFIVGKVIEVYPAREDEYEVIEVVTSDDIWEIELDENTIIEVLGFEAEIFWKTIDLVFDLDGNILK